MTKHYIMHKKPKGAPKWIYAHILKSRSGLIQLYQCNQCGYMILASDMNYENDVPTICWRCAEDNKNKDDLSALVKKVTK